MFTVPGTVNRSWHGCARMETEVEVYARADTVELFINGKSVGKKKPKKARTKFHVTYQDGELRAAAYNKRGKKTGEDVLRTAGAATELRLEPEKTVCHPGEMVYLRMRYTDDKGECKPMEKHRIRVSAINGTVMGTANGSAYFHGNYAQSEVPTYFGEAQAVVKAGAPGGMRVTITDGERTMTAEVECMG